MSGPDLTAEEIRERVTWLQEQRRKGAEQLHSRASFTKPPKYSNAESAAIARAKLEGRTNP